MDGGITQLYDKLKFDGYEARFGEHEELGFAKDHQFKMGQIGIREVGGLENPRDHILVLSDTHDDMPSVERIVSMANDLGLRCMIHAGDIVHDNMIRIMEKFRGRIYGVLGNHDKINAAYYSFNHPQIDFKYDINRFRVGDKNFVLYHGTHVSTLGALADEDRHNWNFLIYGHWHSPAFYFRVFKDYTHDYNCIINPGHFAKSEPVFLMLNLNDVLRSVYVSL